ncbi:MAG: efflux RND transporter permease subunit [Patescibacteria group bacterium]
MHGLWNFFLDKRQFTLLVIISLVTAGIVSVVAIPKENAPEVTVPVAVIITALPGSSALDTAELITKEIEKEVATVEDIKTLSSTSREGVSVVTAEFEASADLETSIQNVKDAVDRAQSSLPNDAEDPIVNRVSFADQPILIVSLAADLPPIELAALAREAEDQLENVPGVSRVDVTGIREREATIVVRKESLALFGISLSEVIGGIAQWNSALPVGSITVNDIDYAIQYDGDLKDVVDLDQVVVGSSGGRPVMLGDIADIVDGIEPERSISRASLDGAPAAPAVTLNVYKVAGGNIFSTSNAVRTRLEELRTTTLAGVTPLVSIDLGEEVSKSLSELVTVGIETVILVMLCLLVTIGWRESLVAGISIPLSFVIAFIGLYVSGNTINFVSLFSLILAIGILVDSGIVVTEAIHTRYKRFGDATRAARESIREYAWPLIAGTMTTVAVFAPLFFISGITGEFIASIPFTIIFVLIASIFVALGLVPLIAIVTTRQGMNALERRQEVWNEWAHDAYSRWLLSVLRNAKFQRIFLRVMGVALVVALILPISGLVKVIFFPQGDSEYIYAEIETAYGTPLTETDIATRAVEELLYDDPRIESFVTTIGESSQLSGASTGGSKYGNITIRLVPEDERSLSSTEILSEYRQEFAVFRSFTVRLLEPTGGPPTGAPVGITFRGESLDDLERAVNIGERVLRAIPAATDVVTSLKDDGTQFNLSVDRIAAASVGLTPAAIAQTLRTAVSGVTATTIKRDGSDIDVVVRVNLNADWRDPSDTSETTLDAVLALPIRTANGTVLLGSVVKPRLEKSNASVRREDQENIATISSYVHAGSTAGEVTTLWGEAMRSETLPAGVRYTLGGETENVDQSFTEMFYALIAGMVLMLAILVLTFNSFRYSFYLLMLVPLSLVGVFVGLAISREPLSFPSLLGVIALAGVIINHAIILVDSILVRMRAKDGRSLEEIVVDGASSRLRPIFLTTVTTVVGMIPLASASALWGPLAFTIMFGLSFAMVLTLVLTPILIYRHPGKDFKKEVIALPEHH